VNAVIVSLLTVFALSGGCLGWWHGTKSVRRLPGRYDRPVAVSSEEHRGYLRLKYRRWRIVFTIAGFVAGGVGGFVVLTVAAVRGWFG
jgi:hypothetical protein